MERERTVAEGRCGVGAAGTPLPSTPVFSIDSNRLSEMKKDTVAKWNSGVKASSVGTEQVRAGSRSATVPSVSGEVVAAYLVANITTSTAKPRGPRLACSLQWVTASAQASADRAESLRRIHSRRNLCSKLYGAHLDCAQPC